MLSLEITVTYLVGSVVLSAWALSAVAKRLGSTRATIGVGLAAVVVISAVNLVLVTAVTRQIPTERPETLVMIGFLEFAVQSCVAFVILARIFRLSFVKTLLTFAVHIATSIAILLVGSMVVRPYLTESFSISSGSMSPTLEKGDCILVNRLPALRRWDCVAYWTVDESPTVFCHRLVGLPGERLRFEDGTLYVDDEPVTAPEAVVGAYHAAPAGVSEDLVRYRDGETITLGSDEYFLIGDNVDRALDSRLQGPTPGASLVGVVDLQYWPPSRIRIFR